MLYCSARNVGTAQKRCRVYGKRQLKVQWAAHQPTPYCQIYLINFQLYYDVIRFKFHCEILTHWGRLRGLGYIQDGFLVSIAGLLRVIRWLSYPHQKVKKGWYYQRLTKWYCINQLVNFGGLIFTLYPVILLLLRRVDVSLSPDRSRKVQVASHKM